MIFHVDLDAFFAAIEQKDNPRLQGKPVLVGKTDPQGKICHRGVVATASYEARAFGVCSGMPIFEALKRCPQAVVVTGHFEKYHQASEMMYQIFNRYTDQIQPLGLDEAFLSFWGFEEFYNNDFLTVAKNIKKDIKDQIGITASIGIAQNKVVAKIASKYQKPDGLTFVHPNNEKEFLSPLPIGKLYGIGPRLEKKLTQIGIVSIGQFANLESELVRSLFGQYGHTLWLWANGIDKKEISPPEKAKSVGRSQTLPFCSNNPHFIKATLFFLCQKIASQLRQQKQKGKCITITVRYTNLSFCSHQKKLNTPVYLAKDIYQIAQKLLDEFWQNRPLRLVGVKVSHLDQEKQLELETAKKEKELEDTVAKIRNKHGFWTIYPASLSVILPFEDKKKPERLDKDISVRRNQTYIIKKRADSHCNQITTNLQ